MEQIRHFFLTQTLFDEQAEEEGIPHFTKMLEQVHFGIWVLDDVVQVLLVESQYPWQIETPKL